MRMIARLLGFLTLFSPHIALAAEANGEYVVMLHGIFRTSAHMQPLADYLQDAGYEVLNLDYPSTHYPLDQLIDKTAQMIDTHVTDKTRKVHFVGYSMGGLLVRGIVAKHRPEHMGRVVLLGTPNRGSEVADFLKNNLFYKSFYGPAGQELGTKDSEQLQEVFGKVDYELGIIAGNFSIDPFSSFLISGEDDGKVSVENTKLEGMKDHITVSASHTFFPSNKDAQKQTLAFLKEGRFTHPD